MSAWATIYTLIACEFVRVYHSKSLTFERVADTGLEPVYTAYEAGLEPPPVESALFGLFIYQCNKLLRPAT